MKTLFAPLSILAALTGNVSAFYGQLRLDLTSGGEGINTVLNLEDYNTGSTYTCGVVNPSFCNGNPQCSVYCQETSAGGYNFNSKFWQTSDGCDNIDFEGALSSGHEWCCGGAPCDIS